MKLSPTIKDQVIKSIKTDTEGMKGRKKQTAQANLLIGAIFAFQAIGAEIPPDWLINVQCGRTDRIFA